MTRSVTLLTAPDCHLCTQAKKVLDRIGEDYPLDVTVVDSETEEGRQLMIEHKLVFPPGVLIDGRRFSFGRLSERKLRRELTRAGSANGS